MLATASRPLRVGFVAGVTPGKWVSRWRERHPKHPLELQEYDDDAAVAALHTALVDVLFVRLPVNRSGLHVIPLYEELPVVVAPKDHEISLFEEISLAELGAENVLDADSGGVKAAVELVAAGAGVVILPMSLARLYARKDVVHRPVVGVDGTTIGIAWLEGDDSAQVEEFIGIVRGRTERSSRQPLAQGQQGKPQSAQKPVAPARRGGPAGNPRLGKAVAPRSSGPAKKRRGKRR